MSTFTEALSSRNRLSEYNIYHESPENIIITPYLNLKKELGYNKKKHKHDADDYASKHHRSDESNSYFLHKPQLLFHDPPRTLRRGSHKKAPPICLINCSAFWREWNIQFASNLDSILDPRGVVGWEHRSRTDNKKNDALALKGYKVRSWRVWGESGRGYHKHVNARRKALREEGKEETIHHEAATAEESVKLEWTAPLSKPRRYQFQYSGVIFYWEGTRDLPGKDIWAKRLMPLNHLKLVAQVGGEKLFLAQYRSDFASKKFGTFWVFDSVVERLVDVCRDGPDGLNELKGLREEPLSGDVRTTRLYEVVMATAMCMILGEWEKRLTVWLILMLGAETANGMNATGGAGA